VTDEAGWGAGGFFFREKKDILRDLVPRIDGMIGTKVRW
jgi:hypothetical protein